MENFDTFWVKKAFNLQKNNLFWFLFCYFWMYIIAPNILKNY